jgi:hypothetical protein
VTEGQRVQHHGLLPTLLLVLLPGLWPVLPVPESDDTRRPAPRGTRLLLVQLDRISQAYASVVRVAGARVSVAMKPQVTIWPGGRHAVGQASDEGAAQEVGDMAAAQYRAVGRARRR